MERDKIIFLRNFFFRAFVVGALFAIVFLVMTLALWNMWAGWVARLFVVDEKDLGRIVLEFFTHLRSSFSFSCQRLRCIGQPGNSSPDPPHSLPQARDAKSTAPSKRIAVHPSALTFILFQNAALSLGEC
jgi:hypothetical protein